VVTHWTGRTVCEASTSEWALRKFLHSCTDAAAVQVVASVLAQRCLETGVSEVFLQLSEEDTDKERMRNFVDAILSSGLVVGEGPEYRKCYFTPIIESV
jgi:large subunit ribosomal protein L18